MTATNQRALRRGLPRVPGGEPWPPADAVAPPAPTTDDAAAAPEAAPAAAVTPTAAPAASAPVTETVSLRRGLPRVPGGEAWPPEGATANVTTAGAPEAAATEAPTAAAPAAAAPAAAAATVEETTESVTLRRGLPRVAGGEAWPPTDTAEITTREVPAAAAPTPAAAPVAIPAATTEQTPMEEKEVELRQGLPRSENGEPWPPQKTVTITVPGKAAPAPKAEASAAPAAPAAPGAAAPRAAAPGAPTAPGAAPAAPAAPGAAAAAATTQRQQPAQKKASQSQPAEKEPKKEAKRYGKYTIGGWAGIGIGILAAVVALAAVLVFGARWLLGLDGVAEFVDKHPGHYDDGAPIGVPAWMGWQHFFNVFLMILIIRSGLQVRRERRPEAYWASRRNPDKKISINLWFHQTMDILWMINGVVFMVLLFITGQWRKIVPTSWEVFPNALSAALQYMTLNWPTENGWVHYNGLQQLAYFVTVFIAAPLAIATGFRMSGMWPSNAKGLSKAYPVEVARALHFPTMIYFVVFIIVHVILVFATGALRNLNHMYATQGSVDPNEYAGNWLGFIFFVISLLVIGGGVYAARPQYLAVVARGFGTVTAR